MTVALEDDRLAHLLMRADASMGYVAARSRLDRAALVLSAGTCADNAWGQAALLTIAECGVRMFRGGVYLGQPFGNQRIVGHRPPAPLSRYLRETGCQVQEPPAHAVALHVGADGGRGQSLRCWADGWTAAVSSKAGEETRPGNELSGVLAGALGITEVFRSVVLDDKRAGRRTQRLSALAPGAGTDEEVELAFLPAAMWLLGVGNLGQATLWTIGLLPYADTSAVTLVLQDIDAAHSENLQVQILTKPAWLEKEKTRNAARWAETLGFRTRIVEQRFTEFSKRHAGEPGLALVGVDNLEARRAAAGANFDVLIDAGLGASATEVFDLRLHAFPGSRSIEQAWPVVEAAGEPPLVPGLAQLVEQGALDRCGAVTIAGRSLGVPSTAVAAAAIQVAQACRAVARGSYCDLVDVGLADCRQAASREFRLARLGSLPFVPARRRP